MSEVAAALAATSLVFEGENDEEEYSKKLVEHARQLFKFGADNRSLYNKALKRASEFYEWVSERTTVYYVEKNFISIIKIDIFKEWVKLGDADLISPKRRGGRPRFYHHSIIKFETVREARL